MRAHFTCIRSCAHVRDWVYAHFEFGWQWCATSCELARRDVRFWANAPSQLLFPLLHLLPLHAALINCITYATLPYFKWLFVAPHSVCVILWSEVQMLDYVTLFCIMWCSIFFFFSSAVRLLRPALSCSSLLVSVHSAVYTQSFWLQPSFRSQNGRGLNRIRREKKESRGKKVIGDSP